MRSLYHSTRKMPRSLQIGVDTGPCFLARACAEPLPVELWVLDSQLKPLTDRIRESHNPNNSKAGFM